MYFALLIFGALFVFTGVSWWRHEAQLKKHQGVDRSQFVGHFQGIGIAEAISGVVYDHFAQITGVRGFQPAPTDCFDVTFKMTDEDLHDELAELLQELGWERPHSVTLKEWDGTIDTLSDVVRWIDWVGTKQNPPVSSQ